MAAKAGKTTKTLVWILMGMLVLGLGGFGATNFSGNVRSVGTVGETEIPVPSYFRALRSEISAVEAQTKQQVTFRDAQALGLPDRVLSQLVVTAALEDEAARVGLSIGDERLAADIRNIPAFQGADGQFSRDAYAFAVDNAGMNERDFEETLRGEAASTVLQGAIIAGTKLPDTYMNTLVDYFGERRSVTWAALGREGLTTGIDAPTDDDLLAWYEANLDAFTLPETKQITYAWLTPDMILDSVEVDEDALREAYEEQQAEFNMPERRLVERLPFADQAAADAAMARVTAGDASFEDLVADRGLALEDTDLGDVTAGDLGAASDIVFGAEVGAVVGPAPTDLGPALFRVNAVLAAQNTSFEEAQPMLRDALALDRARRVIDTQMQGFDDELAAGATLEELATATDLQLGQIAWNANSADSADSAEDIAGYDGFRQAAAQVTADDYPTIETLGDGGVFALRLEEIREAAPQPFEDVRAAVQAGWEQDATAKALVEEANLIAPKLSEGQTFEAAGLTPQTAQALSRTSFEAGLPPQLMSEAFDLEVGDVRVIEGSGEALILRLDEITPADRDSEAAQQLTQLFGEQAANDVAQDLFNALSADIQTRAGVTIDQAARNAVHTSFP